MNWLAHLYLSTDNIEFQLGNVMTDSFKPDELRAYSELFDAGVECHHVIDRFTDTHPVVKQSVQLLRPKYRHYAGILVDVFYDHFLAVNWNQFSDIRYEDFVDHFYRSALSCDLPLSHDMRYFLELFIEHKLLDHYDSSLGVERALKRISKRSRYKNTIAEGVDDLKYHYDDLNRHFLKFFPELINHVQPDN